MDLFSALPLGLLMVVGALAYYFFVQSRKPGLGLVIEPGAAQKLLAAAETGNIDALKNAALQSVHLDLGEGTLGRTFMQYALDEVQRELDTPGRATPVIDIIAHLNGADRQHVLDVFKAFLLGNPAPAPVSAAVPRAAAALAAFALFALLLPTTSSLARAASPLTPPAAWQPSELPIVIDPPVFRGPVYENQRSEILLPNSYYQPAPGHYAQQPVAYGPSCPHCHQPAYYQPANYQPVYYQPTHCQPGYYQPVYYQQGNGGWYPGKLVGRWVRGGGWFPGKFIGRWLFRR